MCFGGGGNSQPYPQPAPPPPQNTPVPPGSDSFQRFQEIRRGMLTGGETQLLQEPKDVVLGQTKGSNVTG
jgi:hypothetical protein